VLLAGAAAAGGGLVVVPMVGGLLPGGVVGRRRRERRQGGRGDGVVLGRARLRLPHEGHRPRRRDAVVHPEGRRGGRALPREQLGEDLAPSLLQLQRPLLVLAGDSSHG
jgi:hypothetical protein